MRGWIGALLAICTAIIALTVDPAVFFGKTSDSVTYGFAAALVSLAGMAFLLGKETSPLFLSRHVAMWMSGFALIAIVASNFDELKPKKASETETASKETETAPVQVVKKRKVAADIYEPDTPKLERVEKIVKAETFDPLAEDESKRYVVKNRLSKKDSELPNGWNPSPEEKLAFKKHLESQGLKYDPETAFKIPEENDAPGEAVFSTN